MRIRRHNQSGLSRRLPAASRLRRRRSDDGVYRQTSRPVAGADSAAEAADIALAGLLLYVTDPDARPWRKGRTLAATFPIAARIELDHGIHDLEIVRERDGDYAANFDGREHRFEIEELGRDTIRFRIDGLMESARFLRDGDRLYIQHRGSALPVRDLTRSAPAATASTGERRQGSRGDERPCGRGSGQAG